MTEIPKREFATAPYFAGVLLLLCAFTFYHFAVLKIDYHKTSLLDLGPYPDAVEYFGQAKAMLKDGWPSIRIGYDKLPSRYPFGYPALMLPWLTTLPQADAVLAPFRTNQTIGLLLLLAVFGFYAYLAMPLTGGFAVLLLVTLPGFFTFCRSSMSDISASAFCVLAFMFAYLGPKEECRWKIYLSAVFLGLSVNIRMQSLFFAPLLLVMVLLPTKGTRLRWLLHCAALPIAFALAASPVLVMNTIQFHSPFKTGYDFWVPYWSENHLLFTRHYIPTNTAHLWSEFALRPNGYFAANIFGTGTSFVAAFVILICAGFFFIRPSRFVGCAFLAGLSYLVAALSYKFGTDGRFYLPLLILLVAVAALPVTWAARNLFVRQRTIAALVMFVLFAAACLGYPSRSGYNTVETDRSQAWDALHFTTPLPRSPQFIAQRRLLESCGREPGVVLSDIDPVYLNALLSEAFAAAPLDAKHHFWLSKIWRYGPSEARALIEAGLASSLPVYALFVPAHDVKPYFARLPAIPGHQWTILNNSDPEALILKLAPIASEEAAPF